MQTAPAFEALAEKLNATLEPEPEPPLPEPVIKGRGGVPKGAVAHLNALAGLPPPPPPSNPFGRNVEVTDPEEED